MHPDTIGAIAFLLGALVISIICFIKARKDGTL